MRRVIPVVLFLLLLTIPALAQDYEIVADGLDSPRGITVDADGNIWVAEAGSGGETTVLESPEITITLGLSGQVTLIAPDGTITPVVDNLISLFASTEGAGLGVYRVYPTADSLWLVMSDVQPPGVQMPGMFISDTVIQLDRESLRVEQLIDLWAGELANNWDGAEEVYSNVTDIAWGPDGTLYIMDTGANALLTWTPEGGLSEFIAWPDNPVPTSLEFAADGSLYISFLGQGIAPGAGRIEHWSADGSSLIETFGDLTAVTDLVLDAEGSVYAVQLFLIGEQGPGPGNVVRVDAAGATPVAEGLMTPFGLAWDNEGNLLVTTGSALAGPGAGAVVRIPVAM